MSVVLEYQAWGNFDYNWRGTETTDPARQIDQKLKAWVATVNAKSGNSGKQITVERDPASTTGVRVGWIIRFTDNVGPGWIVRFYSTISTGFSNSGILHSYGNQEQWTGDATNDGYGSMSNTISTITPEWIVDGVSGEFLIASSTADNTEFFIIGWKQGTQARYRQCLAFFKDQNNRWASIGTSGTSSSFITGIYQRPDTNTNVALNNSNTANLGTNVLGKTPYTAATNNLTAGVNENIMAFIAHPKVWQTGTSNSTSFDFGGYYTVNNRKFFGINRTHLVIEE